MEADVSEKMTMFNNTITDYESAQYVRQNRTGFMD